MVCQRGRGSSVSMTTGLLRAGTSGKGKSVRACLVEVYVRACVCGGWGQA